MQRLTEGPEIRMEERHPTVGRETGGKLLFENESNILRPDVRIHTNRDMNFERNKKGWPQFQILADQSYGIQVQAGMIVGFDNDDESIFEEQLRFIQEARIPVSMTGMLQAMPKTPLHDRMAKEGRLIAESLGVSLESEHAAACRHSPQSSQFLSSRRSMRLP